jgi:hypothetical protein
MEFNTLEQVEAHYAPLIAAVQDDPSRVMELRLERADARESIRDRQDRDRSLADARAEALRQFPYARQEELRGASAEEIQAAAKASHDHVSSVIEQNRQRQDQERQQSREEREQSGRRRYGQGGGAGGSGEVTPPEPSAWEAQAAKHNELMDQVRAGLPFDATGIARETMGMALNEMASVIVQKNMNLLDRGKATSAEEARIERGGVQFE